MGGFGSGRHNYAGTPTVEECRHLESNEFTDVIDAPDGTGGTLSWGDDGDTLRFNIENDEEDEHADAVRLTYYITRGEETQEYDYRVRFDYTTCHFGGVRPWFLCPECGERRGKLYRPLEAPAFACRECYDLGYTSSRVSGTHLEEPLWRYRQAFAKADAKGRRPHPENLPYSPERPKGMHADTFEELLEDVRRAREEWDDAVFAGMRRYAENATDQILAPAGAEE